MQMQAFMLSIQKTVVDGIVYSKCFIGLPANNETEVVSSVMQLSVQDDKLDEIMSSLVANQVKVGELVNISLTIGRGGKNTMRQIVTGITSAQRPGHQPAQQARAEQQKEQK